ncbi:MAG: hypothetical protein K2J89_00620 [Clostridia bacterium]|nr:hypothetical protein [Clostridia bacterium]
MANTCYQKYPKIRFIKITSLKKEDIFKAYQKNEHPIYELRTNLWDAIAQWDHKVYKKLNKGTYYDGTLISVVLSNGDKSADGEGDVKYFELEQLLSLIYSIKKEGKRVYVCFHQKEGGDANKNYFKLSAYLKLWAVQIGMYDDIRFFDTTSEGKKPQRLATQYKQLHHYTSCVSSESAPIMAVSDKAYAILDSTYVLPDDNKKKSLTEILSNESDEKNNIGTTGDKVLEPNKYLEAYLYAYIEKVLENLKKPIMENLWSRFVNNYHPPLLVTVLFATIIKGLSKTKKKELMSNENNKWESTIEHCYSYAQGILQIIDNANRHVVAMDEKKNGAFFGFKIRHDKGNILNDECPDKNIALFDCKSFLQVFVVDCDYNDSRPVGIVAHYNDVLEKKFKEKNVALEKAKFDEIKSLKEIFDYPEEDSPALREYYGDCQNLASHYGLQIFSDVVSSAEGALTVVSGQGSDIKKDLKEMTYRASKKHNGVSCYIEDEIVCHFSGTAYNIFLPIDKPQKNEYDYDYFLGNEPIWEDNYKSVIDKSKDNSNKVFTVEVKSDEVKPDVDLGSFEASKYMSGYGNEPIINIDLADISTRRQIEITCKHFLAYFIRNESDRKEKALCITGFKNEYSMLDAVRVVSLFYNKVGKLEQLKSKGIFLYCRYNNEDNAEEKDFELYFSGANWSSVINNMQRQKLVRNIPEFFMREVMAIKYNQNNIYEYKSDDERPYTATAIKYYLKVKNSLDTVIQKQIKEILSSDVHKSPLGCKISKTHVRIGKVHLDTFYEAQFLFGNAYCTDVFAMYVVDSILRIYNKQDYSNIILYGYETYSTLTLYKAIRLLDEGKMLVYEKQNDRVRYIDSIFEQEEKQEKKTLIVYVMGISSTLSTFKQMKEAFEKACIKNNIICENLYLSIIQIDGEGSEKFIRLSDNDKFAYKSINPYKYTESAKDKLAHFFVSVPSVWYAAEECDCIHCLPKLDESNEEGLLVERPLIEVDETSVVPTQMIFLEREKDSEYQASYDDPCGRDNAKKFLKNEENKKYLRYGHIKRYDNHFQYFLRIAELYHDKQIMPNTKDGEIGIEEWLRTVKDNNKEAFDMSGNTVNILIAPQHFSNTGYVNSVAECIFKGTAHIIELDIRKEYRSNFLTKYSNYSMLAKLIKESNKRENIDGKVNLNFYYVNDQIITGKTFKRAESLINSLLGNKEGQPNGKVFKGVFTLVDRNSYATRKAYVNPLFDKYNKEYLPFFSYLRFSIPSLRNHDNSCPLCSQNETAQKIVESATLTSTVHYWQEKIVYHNQRTSDEMRKIDFLWREFDEKSYETKKIRNFRRLQCENELWNSIGKLTNKDKIYEKIVEIMLVRYPDYKLDQDQRNHQQLSFLDENEEPKLDKNLFESITKLPPRIYLDLFRIIIARLCAIGSCVLLNHKRLIDCLNIGNALDRIILATSTDSDNEKYKTYGEYIISYIKVMSRPLLFYREPVKSAVLKLLLNFFKAICDDAKDRISLIDEQCEKANEYMTDNYYDKTFNGFLLNALKRLLCYDKGDSKCNYCDKYAFEREEKAEQVVFKKHSDFFKRLYIENNRKAHSTVANALQGSSIFSAEFDDGKGNSKNTVQSCDQRGDIAGKYFGMSYCLKVHCGNMDETEIGFFVANGEEVSNQNSDNSYVFIGGDSIEPPSGIDKYNDFYYRDQKGIYYVRIGNNYNRFKERETSGRIYNYCDELGLIQDAYVIIGVKTSNMDVLRKILAFRKEILVEAEKDFNNGVVKKLLSVRQLAQVLTQGSYASHADDPRLGFITTILRISDAIEKSKKNHEEMNDSLYSALYSAIDVYMETMIPVLYKDLIKKNIDTVKVKDMGATVDGLPEVYERSISFLKLDNSNNNSIDACKAIEFVITMLKFKYNKGKDKVSFLYRYQDKNDVDLFKTNAHKIKELFNNFQFVGWFIGNIEKDKSQEQYFEPFMIINTLIKNAKKYGGFNISVIFEKNNKGSIDLIVENGYKEKKINTSGHGMTLKALDNYFGTKEQEDDCTKTWFTHTSNTDKTKFIATIKNYGFIKGL